MAKGNETNSVNWPPKEKGFKPAPRPTSVKVGFYELAILWIADDQWTVPNGNDPGLQGSADMQDGCIRMRVQKDVHEQLLRETLWHEILHACWWHMGLSDHPVAQDKDQEEEIIKRITHASLQVLQDNPDVMAYLSAALYSTKVRPT